MTLLEEGHALHAATKSDRGDGEGPVKRHASEYAVGLRSSSGGAIDCVLQVSHHSHGSRLKAYHDHNAYRNIIFSGGGGERMVEIGYPGDGKVVQGQYLVMLENIRASPCEFTKAVGGSLLRHSVNRLYYFPSLRRDADAVTDPPSSSSSLSSAAALTAVGGVDGWAKSREVGGVNYHSINCMVDD